MKLSTKLFCLLMICMLASTAMVAQTAAKQTQSIRLLPPADANATTTYAGAFSFTYAISIKSAVPMTANILCTANATVADGASVSNPLGRVLTETASVVATRTSATAATCKILMYYSWALSSGATDSVNLSFGVSAENPSTTAGTMVERLSTQELGSIPVPAYGLVTSQTLSFRL